MKDLLEKAKELLKHIAKTPEKAKEIAAPETAPIEQAKQLLKAIAEDPNAIKELTKAKIIAGPGRDEKAGTVLADLPSPDLGKRPNVHANNPDMKGIASNPNASSAQISEAMKKPKKKFWKKSEAVEKMLKEEFKPKFLGKGQVAPLAPPPMPAGSPKAPIKKPAGIKAPSMPKAPMQKPPMAKQPMMHMGKEEKKDASKPASPKVCKICKAEVCKCE